MNTNRRRFLKAAVGLAGATAVAGCGDGDGNATASASPTTAAPSLSISEFAFAADDPAGYGDYEPQPNATYRADEVIWIYLAVDGITGETAGDGEVDIDLDETLTVEGPDGSTVLEEEFRFDREVSERSLESFFIVNDVTLPSSASSGTYTVTVELTDRVAGTSTTTSGEFTIEKAIGSASGRFTVANLALAAAEPTGYNEYEPQPDTTYPKGKDAWVYFNVPGISYELEGDEKVVDLDERLLVEGPDGRTVLDQTLTFDNRFDRDTDLSTYFVTNFFRTSSFEVGQHTLTIELTDQVSGETATASGSFTIDEAVQRAAGTFRVANVTFCASQPQGYREYAVQPDATYTPGDTVWVYFELPGIGYRWNRNVREIALEGSITVTSPGGSGLYENPFTIERAFERGADLSTYHLYDQVPTESDTLSGTATVDIEVTDRLAGETVSTTATFTIE